MNEKKSELKILLKLYTVFFKLGLFCFGGGYAAVPLIEREVVEDKEWLEKEKIVDVFAVAQSLPGAIALNSAAFVGYSVKGIPGAIAALGGNLTPSVLIMILLSMLFAKFDESVYVLKAFSGIRPVIVGLILYATYKIGKTSIENIYCIIIAAIAFVLAIIFNVSVVLIILGGIIAGILLSLLNISLNSKNSQSNKDKED